MKLSHLLFIGLFSILNINLFSQYENVMINNTNNPEEPSIFINPKNPAFVMAGANINAIYISQDSGHTWQAISMISQSGVWGDPCLIADTAGDFYFIHLANPPAQQGNWIDRIVCQKYDISQSNWTYDTYMGLNGSKAQDKAWIAVDPQTNNLYVTWTEFDYYGSNLSTDSSNIMFSRSLDAGASWSQAKRINKKAGDCIDSDNTVEGAVPAVGPNGEIYVAWAGPDGLVFDRSLDSGNTWLQNDIVINPIPGGWDYEISGISRANGLPITLCDISSGANNGTIYINWSDQSNGINNTDIWMVKSTDGGNTWSSPKIINDDSSNRQQFFTWMTIDQKTGNLYCVFYDRRNYSDNRTDVFLAISKDGGQSFENHKISKSPFVPNNNIFFGDYTNISVYNGMVRPIWARLNNDSLSVWTAIINIDSTNTFIDFPSNESSNIEASNFPNPTSDKISFSYKIKRDAIISIEIIDNNGKKISTILNGVKKLSGMYIEHFDVKSEDLGAGVYYFVLHCQNEKDILKKFIVN
ncbi:MAG: glycosyl hydrolase [Bacteroidetes bacterium CG2_30_33_31]|nr:MAG: glycosyl hydrolase [Bacteroidetes bacterium CG2_30_33_31]